MSIHYLYVLCGPWFRLVLIHAAALHRNPSSFRYPPVCLISDSAPVVHANNIICCSASAQREKESRI